MTRGIAETRRRLVEWPLKYDAHTWPRNDNRRTLRPTGRVEYGYNRVQEIVSGTGASPRASQRACRCGMIMAVNI
jgi:hypothetical protein